MSLARWKKIVYAGAGLILLLGSPLSSAGAAPRLDAYDDRYTLPEKQILVEAPGLLANDLIDVKDPVALVLVRPPEHGALILGVDGGFLYQVESGYVGQDTFEYRLTSGPLSSDPALVSLTILDWIRPAVQWVAPVPAEGSYALGQGERLRLEVTASDNEAVSQVVFLLWDPVQMQHITLGRAEAPPYRIVVDGTELYPGWNQVFAIAADPSGNLSDTPRILLYNPARIFLPVVGSQAAGVVFH